MGAGTAPAAIAPRSAITHSGRLGPTMQTASPGFTPSAMYARAALRTSCAASLGDAHRGAAGNAADGRDHRVIVLARRAGRRQVALAVDASGARVGGPGEAVPGCLVAVDVPGFGGEVLAPARWHGDEAGRDG